MKIQLNDRLHEAPDAVSIAALLERLSIPSRFVAVEVNGRLVPREEHAQFVLRDGDQLEVVTLVGGG